MTNRERWLSSSVLLISVLPFILVAGSMQMLPNKIPLPLGEDAQILLSKYQYLYIGLMGIVPVGLVICARILRARRLVERNFMFMILAAMCIGLIFLIVTVYGVINNIVRYKIDLLITFDFFGGSVVVVSLLGGMLANFFPALRRNDVLGLKNKYTMADNRVWVKVHHVAADVYMSTLFLFAMFVSVLSIWLDFRFGWLHLVLWVLVISGLVLWGRLYSRYQGKRLSRGGDA